MIANDYFDTINIEHLFRQLKSGARLVPKCAFIGVFGMVLQVFPC